jgi:radical SAM protein with 4Fe4S-binding SPASM domain
MSLEVMGRVADEAAQYKASVRFGGFGEPLLHRGISKLVEQCKARNIRTTIFTNATPLNKDMMEEFCILGLDEIRFSSSGITPEEHNDIRRKSDYEKDFKEKILMAHEVKRRINTVKPYVTIYTNVFDYGRENFEKQKAEYVSYYLNYVDKIDIDLTNLSRVKELEEVKAYYPKQTIEQKYKPCVTLYHKFIIHWNGDVFACDIPYDFEEAYFLGNLNDNVSMFDMYHSEKIKNLRRMTETFQHEHLKLCKDCYSSTYKYEQLKAEVSGGKI